jgi:hypothetical protein
MLLSRGWLVSIALVKNYWGDLAQTTLSEEGFVLLHLLFSLANQRRYRSQTLIIVIAVQIHIGTIFINNPLTKFLPGSHPFL